MTGETPAPNVLFQLSGVGVVETDHATGRFLQVNETFCEWLGYREAELRTLTYLELTHPDDRGRDAERFAALVRGEQRADRSLTRVLRKDGAVRWLELNITLVDDDHRTRNLAVAVDATERVMAEKRAHRTIQALMSDADAFDRRVRARLAHVNREDADASAELTKRERDILGLLAQGRSNRDIAAALGLTTTTVRNYVSDVYRKIGVHSRTQALLWARARGVG